MIFHSYVSLQEGIYISKQYNNGHQCMYQIHTVTFSSGGVASAFQLVDPDFRPQRLPCDQYNYPAGKRLQFAT